MMEDLELRMKDGKTSYFFDSTWNVISGCVVVSEYEPDYELGGYRNIHNYAFDCEDVEYVRTITPVSAGE